MEVTILMPCLNELETIGTCIRKAKKSIKAFNLDAEVLISDNGSTDESILVAESLGARVVVTEEKGYGNVLRHGIANARGKFVIMADADDSYDFEDIYPFIVKLREGYDLVMGNRFSGGIEKNAMPWLHRYLGNPVLSFLGRLFFQLPIRDFHCGFRGFSVAAISGISFTTTGMEFASEMIIKSSFHQHRITEIPVKLYPDGRRRSPHLRTWHDGWRHLRFLLLYSHNWLFLYPGLLFIAAGLGAIVALLPAPVRIGGVTFDVHTMLYGAFLVLTGMQMLGFYYCSQVFAARMGLVKRPAWLSGFNRRFTLERGLIIGGFIFLVGVVLTCCSFQIWTSKSFGDLQPSSMLRIVIPSMMTLILGTQIILNSFLASILNLKTNRSVEN